MVVLAVADDAMRRQYARCLAENEFSTMDTASGSEAIALAERFLPELVVVDLDLPGHAGLQVVRRIRSDATTMDAGIIALGRGVTPYREVLACEGGCDVVLDAPCPPETLLTELLVMFARVQPSEHLRASLVGNG